MSITLSVVICTFNRAHYLRKAIHSLLKQSLPPETFEVLVVDNGSTDETRQVVINEFKSVTNLHYLYEPKQGLSYARNTGWQQAQGEYVAYLDDDAITSSDWCRNVLKAFKTYNVCPGCVGGKVEPIWETPCPAWVSPAMQHYLSVLDWSPAPTPLIPGQWLSGCNMAFPKRILEKTQGFKTYLGRQGKNLLSMEEVMLQRELQKLGYQCVYAPQILVQHHIPADRLTQIWFLRRAWWNGISIAYEDIYQNISLYTKSLTIGWHSVKNIISGLRWGFMTAIATNPSIRMERTCFVLERLGYLWGLMYRIP